MRRTLQEVGNASGGSGIQEYEIVLSETIYNSIGKTDTTFDELGNYTEYDYDEAGNLVETRTYDSNDTHLTTTRTFYDAEGRTVISVGPYDPASSEPLIATESVYDALGRVEMSRKWNDVEITVENVLNGSGEIVGQKATGWTVDDGNLPVVGNELSYSITEYDAAGRVGMTISLDEDGYEQPTSYEYDRSGRQTAIIDPCGHTINYVQDGDWYVIDTVSLNGTHKTITHYTGTRRDSVTDANGQTTGFTYDALGRIIKTTYPETLQNQETYVYVGYDGLGRKAWESKQTEKTMEELTNEDIKEYEYNAGGRLIAVTLPQEVKMERPDHNGMELTDARARYEFVYDIYGNMLEQWDNIYVQDGDINDTYARVTRFTYDCLNNQVARKMNDNETEYKDYDELGRVIKISDFKAQITKYEYDSLGRLEYKKYYADDANFIADEPNETMHYTYDKLGRKDKVYKDGQQVEEYSYDSEGHILSVTTPEGVVNYDYDPVTSRKSATRTASTETQFGYDAMGRLSASKLVKRNGTSVSELATYEYTVTGNRWKMQLPNGITTSYSHDTCNRLLSVTHDKSGQIAKYEYSVKDDGMREQLAETISTGGGRTVEYGYDNLNRIITESSAESTGNYDVEYTYDVVGNKTKRIINVNGQCMRTDYVYNSRDQLLKETHIEPNVCSWINDKPVYAYANNGSITHYRMFGSSKDIGLFKAYLMGIPTKWPNRIVTAILGLFLIMFFLPLLKRIIHHEEHEGNEGSKKHKLLWRQCLCLLLAYTMLLNPAWLQQEAQAAINYGGLTRGNWGVADREIHYYYDDNGSCVKKIVAVKDIADPETTFFNKTLYTYNLHNQLVEVRFTTNGTTWDVTAYKYNDEGIRVENNVNGTVTTYLVDSYNHTGYAQVLEERTNDVLTKTYIIGDDVIGEVNNYGTLKYYLCDGQGSVRHHTNASGVLISYYGSGQNCNTFAYDAYGNRVDPLKYTAGVTEGLFYCGEQWDAKAKMYYLRSRWYNPMNGLFNQMDSFAGSSQDPQSLHKYLYCHANPINGIDPSGEEVSLTGLTIAMGIGAVIGAIVGGSYAYYTKRSILKGIMVGAAIGAVAGGAIYLLWSSVVTGALKRFFWDPRAFSTISRQYWQKFGSAMGRSLHHWLIPQRWTWIPQGIRNAGFNLLELPSLTEGVGINTWMGFALRWGGSRMVVACLVENGIRILIPVTAYATYHAGKWVGNELGEQAIELAGGASATPLKLTSAEEEEMQNDTGNALLKELK